MSTEQDGLHKDLTYQIIGALYAVHNELGPVHKEVIYQRAVAIELHARGIGFEEEPVLPVTYKGHRIGVYRPDFIIDGKVVLELKAAPMLTKDMFDQIFYYVRGTAYQLVLLANFGTRKLMVKRRIYSVR